MRRAAAACPAAGRAEHGVLEASPAAVVTLSDLHPLIQGVVATVIAAVALSAWIAIGSFFVRATDDVLVALPVSLLVGSGLTATAYAILTRAGLVDEAIWAVGAISLAALAARRGNVRRIIHSLAAEFRARLSESRLLRIVAAPIVAVLWMSAIAMPRDADVMRYHLAHVRQIISDGRWERIPDYHYAFPFGWSLNYLPFERIHLPQAASLVNMGLWLIMLGGLFKITRPAKTIPPAAWLCVAFLVHPFILRVFSTAVADGYALFVVYSIAALLLAAETKEPVPSALLGFVCWIGAQSRYQLVAVAIAGTLVFGGIAWSHGASRSVLGFAKGAVLAVTLCAPFYLANLLDLGNPFWPLLVPEINGIDAYADRVAALYSASLAGHYDFRAFAVSVIDLITTPFLAPLALILVLIVPASLTLRVPRYRCVAIFGTLILVLWAAAQPRLFPKHVILLLPLGALLAVASLDGRVAGSGARRVIHGVFAAAILAMVAASTVFSFDHIKFSLTGNRADFHRFTWYYPVYNWVNHNTPRDARFLVVAYSGHSYYLDRRYRRADPWLSGVVDWPRVSSAEDLVRIMGDGEYDYLIYDDRDWNNFAGGYEMSSAVKSAVARGALVPAHQFRERLYSNRILRTFEETTVYILRRRAGT